jgi:uncharacterized Fe-S cluster protein YjdI
MTKRRYEKQADSTNDQPGIVVLWDSDLCVHCGACHQGLPQVFKPDARPWVQLDGAPATDIIQQVKQCPSQALSLEEK